MTAAAGQCPGPGCDRRAADTWIGAWRRLVKWEHARDGAGAPSDRGLLSTGRGGDWIRDGADEHRQRELIADGTLGSRNATSGRMGGGLTDSRSAG